MRLMLLRHAKSEKAEPGMRDQERGLTARGRRDALAIGAYLARHALVPDLVLASPAQRTRETWERLGPALGGEVPLRFDERLYNAGADTILAVARQSSSAARALLVIGHNPGLHE